MARAGAFVAGREGITNRRRRDGPAGKRVPDRTESSDVARRHEPGKAGGRRPAPEAWDGGVEEETTRRI